LLLTFQESDNGAAIAQSLGWRDSALRLREISQGHNRLDAARSIVAGKSAALFAQVKHKNGLDPVDSAALYAYHSNVDWGLVSDSEGITVFNSHRLVDNKWLRLPKVLWTNLANNQDLLRAFTPDGVMDGAIEAIASRSTQPTKVLQPIDDRLVERLDAWRDQAMRYSRDASGVDQRLQTLYAQLFVLRAVEDRRLTTKVSPIESILKGHDDIDLAAWLKLLKSARKHVGSNLFDQDPLSEIPPHVVAGVIHDLYHPGMLPSDNIRYDFSWIEADVLGAAYEKYLSTVLHPISAPVQTDLFREASHDVGRYSVRKQSGTYYTPKFIHDYLAARTIEQFYRTKPASCIPSIIDFACGSGSFLVAAIDELLPPQASRRDEEMGSGAYPRR
jgi:hypothetical protein